MSRLLHLFFVISLIACINVQAQTVYITKTGEKYHKTTCRYLKHSKKEITLKKAKALGYEACLVCKPNKDNTAKETSTKVNTLSSKKQPKTSTNKTKATQCTGRTKAGNRCKRMTKSSTGRCYQH